MKNFRHHLVLALELTLRELKARYKNTGLGQFWLLVSPLVTIFIYTIIFSDFMKMKLQMSESKYAYSLYLIPGLLSWNFFSMTVSRLSNIFFEKAHMLKKINIPAYVYFLSALWSESILYLIAMAMGLGFLLLIGHPLTAEFLWLLPLMGLTALFALGLGAVLALLSPFLRDLREIVPIVLQLWFWMTPIIYVKEMVIHKFPALVIYNPFYYFIAPMQELFLSGKLSGEATGVALVVTLATLSAAAWLYGKLTTHIKDML